MSGYSSEAKSNHRSPIYSLLAAIAAASVYCFRASGRLWGVHPHGEVRGAVGKIVFDIHYHLLYGLDDGPEFIEDSLALAEASIAEGVTHIVCTPHANYKHKFQPEISRERVDILNDRLGGRITLGLGCDFHLSYENIEDALRNRDKYTINGRQYLLVEFPDFALASSFTEHLYRFVAAGIVPIITHPERNAALQNAPGRLTEWMDIGCLIQVTAASLTGRFGRHAEEMSNELIRKNRVHFIASDAHSIHGRPPSMGRAYEILKSGFGQETADRLCIHNPRAAFFGEPLPPQPEPVGLDDNTSLHKGFFKRLFGRTNK